MRQMRSANMEKLTSIAEMLAFNSSGVVAFQDQDAATDLLRFVDSHPDIEAACIYDFDQATLAFSSKTDSEPPEYAFSDHTNQLLDDGHIVVTRPITEADNVVGTVYVRANSNSYNARLASYLRIAALISICSLSGALVLSMFVQRWFTQPLFHLSKTATRIRNDGDYSLRVERKSQDELGVVCRAFNEMLERIESTQQQLRDYNDNLEHSVAERTAELQTEILKHEATLADLRVAIETAEAANQIKTEFLANMSHEIRTPMNAILGFSQMLRERLQEDTDPERLEYSNIICRSGEHLLSLINDVLDISKIEAGRLEIEEIEFSPHGVVADVTSILRVTAENKGITLDYKWTGSIPETITSDVARLRQLLINLIGNAIKFTEHGGVRVELQLVDEGEQDPHLVIHVIDTGIGISEDKLSHIFDAFSQSDSSMTRRFGGTGLGLAISKRVTEAMGGNIEVHSKIDEGSTFTLRIPTGDLKGVQLLETPQGDVPRVTDATQQPSVKLPECNVLLVEDGETNRKLAKILLERAGATVQCAENGKAAVDLAADQDFDVVLMDMQMPVMDGYTATRTLRENEVTSPIIALTAHALAEDRGKCIDAGCDDFVTKPINEYVLLSTIRRWLVPPGESSTTSEPNAAHASGALQPDYATMEDAEQSSEIFSTLPTDLEEYREAINEFVEKFASQVEAMETAAATSDFTRIRELAHWAKGSGGTAGFPMLTLPSTELGAAARTENLVEVKRQIAKLQSYSKRMRGHSEPIASA